MADKFVVNRGNENPIQSQQIDPGAIWLTEDGQSLYLDSKDGTKRIQITNVIDLSLEQELPTKFYPNKIYISVDGKKLQKASIDGSSLETISELENTVLESEDNFLYNEDNPLKATLIDNSSPKNGTIVIANNGDVGIVTSRNNNILNITVIANKSIDNVVSSYDLYVDSNYSGLQDGSINHPFNNWNSLYTSYNNLLHSDVHVTIHFKDNTDLSNESIILTGLNEVTFEGSNRNTNTVNFLSNSSNDPTSIHNINFKNLTVVSTSSLESFIDIYDGTYVIDNCYIKNLIASNSGDVTIHNSTIDISDITNNCGMVINVSDSSFNNIVIMSSTTVMTMNNCNIKNMHTNENSDLQITLNNCTMRNISNLQIESLEFIGGKCLEDGTINLSNVRDLKLGTLDYSECPHISFPDNISIPTGLSSKQIYDSNTDRAYGVPSNLSIEAHLDKIGEKFESLQNGEINPGDNTNPDGGTTPVVINNAFTSKKTFSVLSDLNGIFKIGDVMTYVGNDSQNLEFVHNLTFESLSMENENAKGNYFICGFILENADYFIKINDTISMSIDNNFLIDIINTSNYPLTSNSEIISSPIEMSVSNIIEEDGSTKVIAGVYATKFWEDLFFQCENAYFEENDTVLIKDNFIEDLCIDIISEILNNESTELKAITFNQIIPVSYKDRLVRLTNCWDKLSGSSNDSNTESAKYYIVSTRNDLNDENIVGSLETRTLGTLAYIQDEHLLVVWTNHPIIENKINWENVTDDLYDNKIYTNIMELPKRDGTYVVWTNYISNGDLPDLFTINKKYLDDDSVILTATSARYNKTYFFQCEVVVLEENIIDLDEVDSRKFWHRNTNVFRGIWDPPDSRYLRISEIVANSPVDVDTDFNFENGDIISIEITAPSEIIEECVQITYNNTRYVVTESDGSAGIPALYLPKHVIVKFYKPSNNQPGKFIVLSPLNKPISTTIASIPVYTSDPPVSQSGAIWIRSDLL